MSTDYSLSRQNLVPFYLIEDRLKENFTKIEQFITNQLTDNSDTNKQINKLKNYNECYRQQMNTRFVEMEKKIVKQINAELDGRIVVAINKNMASFTAKMEEKEKQIQEATSGIYDKLDKMKKELAYENSKENQKLVSKQIEKINKKIKSDLEQVTKKIPNKTSVLRPVSREKSHSKKPVQARDTEGEAGPEAPENYFTEEWVLRIKQLETKTLKFEEFAVNVDKRMYDGMSSLKESWKQLGQQILETKRKLVSKQDELKLQLIKIKGIKEFNGSPQDYQQIFKQKLMDKFTDIYQLLSTLITRADFDSSIEKIKKTTRRHDEELSQVREELGKNSDYFTFYVNNSNEEDLSGKIKELQNLIIEKDQKRKSDFQDQKTQNYQFTLKLEQLSNKLGKTNENQENTEKAVQQLRGQIFQQMERIDILEQQNNFSPQKMAKIHNTLDIDFTPTEQELLSKKSTDEHQSFAMKEMKIEMNKLKDQLFVLNHELTEIDKIKKSYTGLENKIDKIKLESEEAILTRKPWMCLSCDKNQKEKESLRKEASRKKIVQNRGGLFTNQKSQKLIKLIPATEQKFQVYEKYREKYMNDSVRLPEIYKQKIGQKEPPLN